MRRNAGMKRMWMACVAALAVASGMAMAQTVPSAITEDPPANAAHPAGMIVLHIPSHGEIINGIVYTPAGAGPHPTLILCHGLPGNEKNLDLAQAARRAGWNAVTFNYRGSWGSPGKYGFAQNLEDTDAVLAYLREPAQAKKLDIDSKRIVLLGHSMGGWATAMTAAHDHALAGAILISAADFGMIGSMDRKSVVALMAENHETLNATPEAMADETIMHAKEFNLQNALPGLAHTPLLVLTSDDGLAPRIERLMNQVKTAGNPQVTLVHAATDHGWNDHRIFLETTVLNWLAALQ